MHDEVQIPGWPATRPRLALPREADAPTVAHAGGDVHAQLLDGSHGARAVTGRAGVLDHSSRTAAERARLGDREHALALGLHAAAFATRTDGGGGAGLGAGAVAGGAGRAHGNLKRDLRARDRLVEADRDLRLQVVTALDARASPGARGPPVCPRACPPGPPAPPNRFERMSPIEEPSKSKLPKPPKPPPGPPPEAKAPEPLSYCLRFSGSPSTSWAWEISLNFASASLSPGLVSGWYFRASLR